jgi:hypothetical protein
VIRPATLADVGHIGKTMWLRGKQELGCLGVTPQQWIYGWARRIKRGDAVAFGSHAILGCDWESEDVVNTSFQASASFEDPRVGKAVTKAMRQEIPRLMEERGIRLFNTYSLCVDPSAEKWFRLLGLEEDKDYRGIQRGPYTTRRFFRRR